MKIPTKQGIPIVDMSQPITRWKEIVRELRQALQYTGFVYLVNHGIPEHIVDSAFQQSTHLFALPLDEKMKFERDLQETFHGYTKPGLKVINPKSNTCLKELRESFDCNIYNVSSCPYPDKGAEGFKPAMHTLMSECKELAIMILKMLGDALDLSDQEYFLRHHRCLWDESAPNFTSLRSLFYPQITKDISGAIRFDEHTDYGTFTLLFQDDVGGLEVKTQEGNWIPATPIPGSIVVNTGDLLNSWSGGLYTSTVHRVIVPQDEFQKQKPRQSIAFFVKPDNETVVVPLVNPENPSKIPEFQNVTAGEHFKQRTMSTRRT
ncbi:hypothetical protein Ocin01_00708 [Orchesella cincta]|uniref:Fe2OG dioxygenase domain-containing protein n=1 Tax=Orchesella cincta TaxID=48709 RepID=A0A1D2NL17_ORCCI|nr:hypothetical protein Ocin01_00708 [Orchesella cincta]